MKRTLITILSGLVALVSICVAGDPQPIETLTIASASTNAAAITADTATTTVPHTGYIDYIDVDITTAYASPTCTVTVATSGATGTRPAATILSKVITADTAFYPAVLFDTSAGADITGAARRFPLAGDKITVSAYANNTTNALQAVFRIGITKQP